MADSSLRPWAYGLTVAGGALIVAGAGMLLLFWSLWSGGPTGSQWWMSGGHMWGPSTAIAPIWFVLWGVLAGAAVLWSGVRMRPGGRGEGTLEGIVAIVASALSFPAMGGFMVGALLGVVGGALSLAEHAHEQA